MPCPAYTGCRTRSGETRASSGSQHGSWYGGRPAITRQSDRPPHTRGGRSAPRRARNHLCARVPITRTPMATAPQNGRCAGIRLRAGPCAQALRPRPGSYVYNQVHIATRPKILLEFYTPPHTLLQILLIRLDAREHTIFHIIKHSAASGRYECITFVQFDPFYQGHSVASACYFDFIFALVAGYVFEYS